MSMRSRLIDGRLAPPASIRQARDMRQQCAHELAKLEGDLNNPEVSEERIALDETWPARARKRGIYLREEIRQLDEWLEANANPEKLLREAWEVLKRLETPPDGFSKYPLSVDEALLMERLDDYFFEPPARPAKVSAP